jgi:hypothetical protein
LTHIRVFLLYLPFAVLVWAVSRGRNGRWLALSAGLSALLSSPRIVRLIGDVQAPGVGGNVPGYNEFPAGYINTGWERVFLILLGLAMLLTVAALFRSRRWVWLPLILIVWAGLVGFLLSGDYLGLPITPLVNLNSAYISFFLPLALILAVVADRIWTWLNDRPWPMRAVGWAVAGLLLGATTLFGIHQQIDILNRQTMLAFPEDIEGLNWLAVNLLPQAKVAVNSWQWLGNTWTGNDGGAWITPVTGRASTTPPADYIYDRPLAQEVNAFNEKASQVEDWSDEVQVEWLREQGITHIFVGARGGFFDVSELSRNPALDEVFDERGVFIFAIK